VPIAGELNRSSGRVNAIAGTGVLYGWVRTDPEEERKAARWENGWTKNSVLEDKFQAYGYSDQWQLEEFIDATDKDVILGNCKKNGVARSFLLIPQPSTN
jgi:hypothetical protein